MKVYLDQSIIDEWLKFKSSGVSLTDYAKGTRKPNHIIGDLEAFGKILEIRPEFLYSTLNELECSKHRKDIFDNLVSQYNFRKVPANLRRCMVDQTLPEETRLAIGECESYFASNIRKFGLKNITDTNNLMKYMCEKFFDSMHIDSALQAKADFFLTIDYRLLQSIEKHPEFSIVLSRKIKMFTPSKFVQKVVIANNSG